jgi:excisionase family DNA binding protein
VLVPKEGVQEFKDTLYQKLLGDLVTDRQLADLVQVSLRTIHGLFRKGALPGKKVGRSWVITRDALLAALSTERHEPHLTTLRSRLRIVPMPPPSDLEENGGDR